MIWSTRRHPIDLTVFGRIMGILNITPDSFSDGGKNYDPSFALEHGRRMISEGAEIIDIGGESTRPGAAEVSEMEEIARTIPIIRALRKEWGGWISIDTSKAAVAEAALHAGADIVNDVCGLRDPAMVAVCAAAECGVVVMHMQGSPRTMQLSPTYEDVAQEIRGFFEERHTTLTAAGIKNEALCFDPGIGFGKTLEHNLTLLRSLDHLGVNGRPLLLGVSRKSFLGQLLEDPTLEVREWPTAAITSLGREKGVLLHRVHNVKANLEAMRMTEAILGAGNPTS
jgi:dihydropteroate synthase